MFILFLYLYHEIVYFCKKKHENLRIIESVISLQRFSTLL